MSYKDFYLTLTLSFQVFGTPKSGFPRLYFDPSLCNVKSKETVFTPENIVK
jgi:hypothetical protein